MAHDAAQAPEDAETALREALVAGSRELAARGLNEGTSGNLSVRLRHPVLGPAMLLTPSAAPPAALRAEQMALMPLSDAAADGRFEGPLRPSTEWRFHRDILRARPEAQAVVHAHPPFCTALAMARRPIPPCHYMIAAFGGTDVRCAPYATFGTAALSAHALAALEGRNACLLANHGMIAVGPSLSRALWLAVELETLARQYHHSLAFGGPVLLDAAQIGDTAERFAGYGRK